MATRGETPTRHYDEKLEAILKCAAKIFAEKGYHSTSIRDISRETGMSLAGLYYYFRTKEELLFLIQERCILTLLQRWETVNPDADARVRIRIFAENHLGFFLHNMHEMKVMAREDESLTGDFQEQMLVLKRRYVKILMDVIGEVQGRESVRVVDTRIATFSLFGMMNWIYTWYHPKRDLPLPQLIEQMLRIYFFGMLKGGEAAEPWFTSDAAQRDDASFSLWRNLPD
ncbi:MAG TPA: TetR/AcrR family transcriptional regulator [Candidatus Binatia bacterium]|jgi:AcrR family transcriptional regulator|nr:TetR/AcrR family transcriptional regulator [Candidatus Binatia bacterium]